MDLLAFVRARHPRAGVPRVDVVEDGAGVVVTVACARPGLLIGKQGKVAEELTAALAEHIGKPVQLKILELRRVELEPLLVADSVVQRVARAVADQALPPEEDWTPEPPADCAARAVRVAVDSADRAGGIARVVVSGVVEAAAGEFVAGDADARVEEGGVVVEVWIKAKS